MHIYRKKIKSIFTIILTITILLSSASTSWAAPELLPQNPLFFFIDIMNHVKSTYPFEVGDEELIENSIKGMLQGLDKNSDYYNKEEAGPILENLEGNYAGIGVVIEKAEENIVINSVMKNSPAQKAGLKEKDILVSVDETEVKYLDLQEVSNLIRGPEDTKVRLGVLRENKSLPLYIDVVRESIEVNPVEYEILNRDIGYIKLSEFNRYADKYIKEALEEIDRKNIDKIILDLRDNPGGQLNQAIKLGQLFVPEGPLVHIRNKQGITTHISTNKNPKYKLAVLVNENSASASEILAGAIKERDAGILIGIPTYGKGTVQTLIPIIDGSLVKLTTAEYLLPNKTSIHGVGIDPDIQIDNEEGKDLQLKKAVELLDHWGHSPQFNL